LNKDEGLSAWQLTMFALGTVVGGSFFLGSAIAIKAAGSAILLSFIIGGILVYFILTALSEMTVADPQPGSFRTYAEKAYGSWLGFLVGWVYWTGMVLAMSSEATAVSILLRSWIPQFSLPLLSISVVLAVTLLNLLGTKKLSNLESGLASIKLAALIGFIILAAALIAGWFPGKAAVGLGFLGTEPFFLGGIGGIAGSMLIVLFSYAGFETIGLASSEARDPHRTVRKAIRYTVLILLGLYILVIALMLPLLSAANLEEDTSPMVAALNGQGLNIAAGIINIVLITAIISTMLAAMFGLGRMLRSLADSGNAPSFLVEKGDIPFKGIIVSGLGMLIGVSMAYILPDQIYIFLVSSGGFSLLFSYLIILISHKRFRAKNGCPPAGHCQLPGYPYTSWIAIISLIVIIATMPLIEGQGSGLFAGLILVLFYILVFYLAKVYRLKHAITMAAAKPLKLRKGERKKP
jgi:AAT family amino acid transporter